MRGVEPDKVLKFTSKEDRRTHRIYLWTTPLTKTTPKGPTDKTP